ncbi:Fructose-1,6-bisphosphatase [Venturia inaequalis]|nr:Fructose-1,6-bisphosphatase [Venturia inaequalis]
MVYSFSELPCTMLACPAGIKIWILNLSRLTIDGGWNGELPRTTYKEELKIPTTIKAIEHGIIDVKAIVTHHTLLDYAGVLEHFFDSGVPIITHEE